MANKKRELRFNLNDDDYKAFGRYRILYTEQGRKMVSRNRLTYLITAVMIAVLFTVFHVDQKFTYLMYAIAAALVVVGIVFSEKMVLKQQDNAIEASKGSAEWVHAPESVIRFDDESFTTTTGEDVQTFRYEEIKLMDLTEEGIYVWMSDTMIMPLPLHAFQNMDEMKELYKWVKAKNKEQGGNAAE